MPTTLDATDALRRSIAELAEAGVGLAAIERDLVEPAPLDEDRRAALWLYAWSRVAAASPDEPGLRRN